MTILDYLDWRGDIPFSLSPVNEVDRYILCKFGMLDYTGIVPEDGTYLPARQAVDRYFAGGGADDLGVISSRYIAPVLRRAATTERFGGVMLSGWRLHISQQDNEQFSAVTVCLPDGQHYVTFRGTDDTLVGWKENLLMTVMDAVPAQADALKYLQWACDTYPGQLIVGGHSKGGNLSVYSAACLEPEKQKRISFIFNFDGPGFKIDFLQSEGYLRIRDRIQTVVPRNTTVGSLLYRESECDIVLGNGRTRSAHDGFTWEVTPTDGFVRAETLSPGSRAFDRAMKGVLEGMTPQQRRDFIDEFFGTLSASGAVTLTDLTERRLRETLRTVRSLNQEPQVHRLMMDSLEALVTGYAAEKGWTLSRLRLPGALRRRRDAAPEEKPEADWYSME